MKTKLYILYVIIFSATLFLFGCGKDGVDGQAFLSYDWVAAPYWYNDDNPRTPSTIFKGTNYEINPGTYSFSYEAWDNSVWFGTYKITINSGEKGGLIKDGEDGEDKYFTLYLYSIGPSLSKTKKLTEELKLIRNKYPKYDKNSKQNIKIIKKDSIIKIDKNDSSNLFYEYRHIGNVIIELNYHRVNK